MSQCKCPRRRQSLRAQVEVQEPLEEDHRGRLEVEVVHRQDFREEEEELEAQEAGRQDFREEAELQANRNPSRQCWFA